MILLSETVIMLIFYMLALVIMIGCVCCMWLQRSDMMRRQCPAKIRVCRHCSEVRAIHGMVTPTDVPELNQHPMLEADNSLDTDTKKHAWFDSHV